MIFGSWVLLQEARAHPDADQRLLANQAVGGVCDPEVWLEQVHALTEEGRVDAGLLALQRARECGADTTDLALARGLLLADTRPDEAVHELDAVLLARPDHQGARAARARLLVRTGQPALAITDLQHLGADAPPDDRVLLAHLLVDAGRPEDGLAALDAGSGGPAVVLEAVRIEVLLGRPEAALGRLDAMPDTAFWQAQRAKLAAP